MARGLLTQDRQDGPGDVEDAEQVGLELVAQLLLGDLLHSAEQSVARVVACHRPRRGREPVLPDQPELFDGLRSGPQAVISCRAPAPLSVVSSTSLTAICKWSYH